MTDTQIAGDEKFSNSTIGERQLQMKKIFIEHDRFKDARSFIARAHYPAEGGVPDFGTISVLAGESRAGKTSVAKQYLKAFPVRIGEGGVISPVVYVNIPIDGHRALLCHIANALGLKYSQRVNTPTLLTMIKAGLMDQAVELLIFDEVNKMVAVDNHRGMIYTLHLFRTLVDECNLNIVCIGLEETYELLSGDDQVTGRGGLPSHIVKPYSWQSEDERLLFRLLCDEFDSRLPFNTKANLQSGWFAHRLFYTSKGGYIGRLSNFLYRAGCLALNDGSDGVEVRHLAQAFESIKEPQIEFNPWVHDISKAPPIKPDKPTQPAKSARDAFKRH